MQEEKTIFWKETVNDQWVFFIEFFFLKLAKKKMGIAMCLMKLTFEKMRKFYAKRIWISHQIYNSYTHVSLGQ